MWTPQKFLNLDVLRISLVFGNRSCDNSNNMNQMQHSAMGFPGSTSVQELTCQCRRCKRLGFDPWIRKIPWRMKWQPTSVFLPGKLHGQKSLVGYSPWDCKESDTTEHAYTYIPFSALKYQGKWHAMEIKLVSSSILFKTMHKAKLSDATVHWKARQMNMKLSICASSPVNAVIQVPLLFNWRTACSIVSSSLWSH